MAHSVYGTMWVNMLLKCSMVWTEWTMTVVRFGYRQTYPMENPGAFHQWHMNAHPHTKIRSWGTLLYNLFTNMTSPFSRTIHGLMLQGSVHTLWQLKMSQFFNVLHTQLIRHVTSVECSRLVYTTVFSSSHQYLKAVAKFVVGQNCPGHNKQHDQCALCVEDGFCCYRQMVAKPERDKNQMNLFHCQISIYNQWNLGNGWVFWLYVLFSINSTQKWFILNYILKYEQGDVAYVFLFQWHPFWSIKTCYYTVINVTK